jgi:uncharacterized OB-fold protein
MQPGLEPYIRSEAKEYWDSLNQSELRIQRCKQCNEFVFYPREFCPNDMGPLEYVQVSGKGKVLSFTVVQKDPNPVFSAHLPMIVAIIQLAEGPTMLSRLIDIDPNQAAFDQDVEIVFEKIAEGQTLPFFRPVNK